MIAQENISYTADEIKAMVKTCEKYNKALERAKECLQDGTITTIARDYILEIFPELRESEDERIKKAIIRILKGETVYISKEDTDRYIAWLEKQGETFNADITNRSDKMLRAISTGLTDVGIELGWSDFGGIPIEEIKNWLEKQNKHSSSNIPSRETILAIWDLGNEWKELTNGSISTEYGTQLKYIQKHWQESSYYDNIMEGSERK